MSPSENGRGGGRDLGSGHVPRLMRPRILAKLPNAWGSSMECVVAGERRVSDVNCAQ